MKISFLSIIDFANVLTEYSYCLNKHSKDIESKSICFQKHPFNYNIQHDYDVEECDADQITKSKQFLLESDIIIFAEESWEGQQPHLVYKTIEKFSIVYGIDLFKINAKFCIWHPGSCYREVYPFYNNHPQRKKIHKHFYGIDLYRLSNKEQNDAPMHAYQYIDFNYNKFITTFKEKLNHKPWTILHIPSKTQTKGTNIINRTINDLHLDSNKFQYKVLTNIPHSVSISEKQKSIFYIDQFWPQGCGGYGVSTLESLFTSNFTFSTINNITDSMFKLTGKYECPVVPLGTTEEELLNTLNHFIKSITEDDLIGYMEGIGKWLEECYSVKSVIKFFKSI
tara:strand:- start:1249 stop:2262 length:1014 start_codon:yes stop_codon:yes gene_type:complete